MPEAGHERFLLLLVATESGRAAATGKRVILCNDWLKAGAVGAGMKVFGRMRHRRLIALVVAMIAIGMAVLMWDGLHPKNASTPRQDRHQQRQSPVAAAMTGLPQTLAPDRAPSPELERCMADLEDAHRQRVDELAQRLDARSQLAYALTVQLVRDPGLDWEKEPAKYLAAIAEQERLSQEAFATARALAPDDADIRWLSSIQCSVAGDCEGVRQALMRAEPDNAAVWLLAMNWAQQRKDAGAEREAFRRASKAAHYDRHMGSAFMAVTEAFKDTPFPTTCSGADVQKQLQRGFHSGKKRVTAIDFALMVAAMHEVSAMPALGVISGTCRSHRGEVLPPSQREGCLHFLSLIAGGDTLLEQGISLSLLAGLTADMPQGPEWRERYRNYRWITDQFAAMSTVETNSYAPDWVAGGEVSGMQRFLQERGRWPPPANWLPDDEHARSLIQTGRPPPKPAR